MSIRSVAGKDQVTIIGKIRKKSQLQPGGGAMFEEKDEMVVTTQTADDIEALGGCLADHTNGQKATLDDMEDSIQAAQELLITDPELFFGID
ncbi:hypothetical protein [Endozoicomonas sp. 8E]|uniref:hypothetical protein n=1 Tax=Endozoicomonas sp. 8E TaxID=3035692 RepID=UPI002938DFAA|nr:hypothetical protein [Endozoicomonas sp. 8E]WOG25993.1 hypothetical protein P6910_15595 [Endozoicomonas sp. 8E]